MTYNDLPTLARLGFMFIFMLAVSYFLLGMCVQIVLGSVDVASPVFLAMVPVLIVKVAFKKYLKEEWKEVIISLVVLALIPATSVISYLQAPIAAYSSALLLWWPLVNAVILYISIFMLLKARLAIGEAF